MMSPPALSKHNHSVDNQTQNDSFSLTPLAHGAEGAILDSFYFFFKPGMGLSYAVVRGTCYLGPRLLPADCVISNYPSVQGIPMVFSVPCSRMGVGL